MEIELKIEMKDKVIKLSEYEARELYNKLHGMFGQTFVQPYYIPWTQPKWPYGVWYGTGHVTESNLTRTITSSSVDMDKIPGTQSYTTSVYHG